MSRIAAFASLSAAFATLAFVGSAAAAGFQIRENSAEAVGMAYAGEGSLADDPSTAFNNPAGMAFLEGNWLEFGSGAIFPTVNFHGGLTSPLGTALPGNNSGDGGRAALIPHGYGVYHINDRLTAGFAVTAPIGNMIKYNSNFFGRYTDLEFAALTVNVNPTLAYKVNDRLSVAGGLSAEYLTGTFVAAINQGEICAFLLGGACPATTSDGGLRFKGDNWAFGYNVALLYKPWTDTRVGLTYRSKIEHQLHGSLNYQSINPVVNGALGPLVQSGPTTVDAAAPATVGLSVTHELTPALTVAADLAWTQWHSFNSTNLLNTATGIQTSIVQHYQNSWMVSAGVQYHLTSAWTVRGGLGWDQSPVTNEYRSVSLPDQDRYMVAVGLGYAFNEHLAVDGAYAHYFATHGSINDSSTDTDALGNTAHGTYQLSIDYLIASLKYKF
jgi:long-chain fatty acid transport protein